MSVAGKIGSDLPDSLPAADGLARRPEGRREVEDPVPPVHRDPLLAKKCDLPPADRPEPHRADDAAGGHDPEPRQCSRLLRRERREHAGDESRGSAKAAGDGPIGRDPPGRDTGDEGEDAEARVV